MSPPVFHSYVDGDRAFQPEADVPNVVVVDPEFDNYKQLAASARLGMFNLHFRSSGAEAIKLARRLHVAAWLVAPELDDVSGADFIELLQSRIGDSRLAIVDPAGSKASGRATAEGVTATLTPPITIRDLEKLLDLPVEDRRLVLADASPAARAFVTLPVGVSAAVVAIAVLMLS